MLGIVKGDVRYDELAKIKNCLIGSELADFFGIDSLLLPFGGIDEYYNIKQSNLNILDILRNNRVETIFVGNANSKLIELCDQNNIKLVEILKDEDFVLENSFLTAMGIVFYLNRFGKSVKDYKIVILGYGNIGYSLAELLKAYKVEFSIYPTNQAEEKYLKLRGFKISDLFDFDLAINTIPFNLDWNYDLFIGKQIIDVASAPYGFDILKIDELGINYEILSAIPSKFSPITAANILKKCLEKYL